MFTVYCLPCQSPGSYWPPACQQVESQPRTVSSQPNAAQRLALPPPSLPLLCPTAAALECSSLHSSQSPLFTWAGHHSQREHFLITSRARDRHYLIIINILYLAFLQHSTALYLLRPNKNMQLFKWMKSFHFTFWTLSISLNLSIPTNLSIS